MKKNHNIIDKKTLYSGFFEIHQFTFNHKKHNGSWSKPLIREVFSGSNVVTILPYDPKAKKIILIDQFRNCLVEGESNPFLKEIAAGFIDKGESPEEAAERELNEETMLRGRVVQILGTCSHFNTIFGDILLIGMEIEVKNWSIMKAGDDAAEAALFPLDRLPKLAFPCYKKIVNIYKKKII